MRIVRYLVHLGLGDGAAGTPLPVPPQAAGSVLAKAVDRLGLEVLVAAWSDLGHERASFGRKSAALRALAGVTRASLTSRPEDGTYVQGLFETLRGLLDKMDALRAGRRGLAHFISQAAGNKKKNAIADIRQRAEMWGLMRCAFAAARVALPRSGLYKVAQRSLSALGSSDPVCARHALALASLVARDPAGAGSFIAAVEPLLRNNVEAAKRTGALHLGIMPVKRGGGGGGGGGGEGGADPAETESHLNLRDTWARVYLARACAAVIQSGHIAGDVSGRGAVFWQALLLLAVADPAERVALEAIRALFGAPYPRATSAAAMRQPGAGSRLPGAPGSSPAELEAEATQPKIAGASWHLVMTQALEQPPGLPEPAAGGAAGAAGAPAGAAGAAAGGAAAAAAAGGAGGPVGGSGVRAEDTCVFGRIARRLMRFLQSRSHSLVCGAARAVAVMCEARAWFHALSGGHGHEAEPEVVRRWVRGLGGFLLALAFDDSVSGCERAAALEALVWSQGLDQPPNLTPGLLLRAAGHGGLGAPPVARYTFADPWPEPLCSEVLAALARRLRCATGLPPELVLELAGGLAAGSPTGVPREALASLWDMAPGPLAVRAALQLLGAPLPPLCCPPAAAAVEVKALACAAEAAFNGLKAMAATWLGEHVNSVAGEYAWKSWEHKLGLAAAGDPDGLTLAASGSLVSGALSGGLGGAGASGLAAAAAAEALARRGPAVSVGGGGAAGGGAAAAPADEAVSRLAVAGVSHNPLLSLAASHLHRAVMTGPAVVRVASAQALAKVAVRSGEPYRIQAYSLLAAAAGCGGGPAAAAGGGGPGDRGGPDPLGLAPVVGPALEVLDAMYAGELVLERHVGQYGPRARGWPAPALEALRRRHEWLLGAIAAAVCAVPRELFLPLGPRSRRLLYPNEKEEAEEDARAAAAAAPQQPQHPAAAEGDQQYYYDEYGNAIPYDQYQYDYSTAEQYDYGDYYQQQQAAAAEADPYAQHQDAWARYETSGGKAAAAVELHWGDGGGDGGAGGGGSGADAYGSDAAAAESRPGVVLYSFVAENEDEVSVSAGDHVRVLADLGEWFQVAAPGGGAVGLVPASYVQLQDGGGGYGGGYGGGGGGGLTPSASGRLGGGDDGGGRSAGGAALSPSSSFASRAPASATGAAGHTGDYGAYTYQYDNPEYDNSGAGGGYYGDYGAGGGQYGAYDAYGGGGGAGGGAGMYGDEGGGGKKKGGFGGFDDFGAVLAEAKTAVARAQQAPPPAAASPPPPPASITDTSSAFGASPESSVAAAAYDAAPAAADGGAATPGGGGAVGGFGSGFGFGGEEDNPWASATPAASETQPEAPAAAAAYGGAADEAVAAVAAVGGGGGGPALAMYEFVAEMEGELSVGAGEALELLSDEVDGWYTARVAADPSRTGLIPASYVQRQ
ncbi:hypothetical protein HXX76_015649 [Chlamydomonas incerta]|uniref:SH3 domain-containing protein n=1 Tax=Chlamydomonas incerta TaxID=51695 RepID=A0A835S907_CHLIN|nr:hypothetical protein HXX76_015649 [Chlamydomonas incerta]|eukprot:KAG2422978.1 hypothetical protein HXX76_015649 [Chlamydomonas incerta]